MLICLQKNFILHLRAAMESCSTIDSTHQYIEILYCICENLGVVTGVRKFPSAMVLAEDDGEIIGYAELNISVYMIFYIYDILYVCT